MAAADRAHALALLITLVLRELVDGDVPLFLISKPTPRTGAGLLVRAVSVVATGAPIAPMTVSANEEEMRKRLTAALIPAPALLLLDNLAGKLESPSLAAILTCGGTWRDRVLGHSRESRGPGANSPDGHRQQSRALQRDRRANRPRTARSTPGGPLDADQLPA